MRIVAGSKKWESAHIEKWDWILIIGLTLAPMTSLRFWKIGPGEVLCLLWGIKYWFRARSIKSNLLTFFVLFDLAMAVGSVIGYAIAPDELRAVDLLTWLYLGIMAVSLYEGLKSKSLKYNEALFYSFAQFAAIWNLFLFLYSRFVSSMLLGAPLWYHGVRYSGGATNPHQVAILLCGATFVFLRSIFKREKVFRSIVLMAISIYLMIATASSTGILAIALGMAVSAYFFVANLFPKRRFAAWVVLTVIILLAVLIFYKFLYQKFIGWVAEDKNGMRRFVIFSSFGEAFMKSPVFGLGPGVHGIGGTIEFHNTYLEIIAATGLVGGIIFAVYSIDLFISVLKNDWKLFPILVSMYAYGLAGFAMRRIVFWGLVSFVTIIAEQKSVAQVGALDNEHYSVRFKGYYEY